MFSVIQVYPFSLSKGLLTVGPMFLCVLGLASITSLSAGS